MSKITTPPYKIEGTEFTSVYRVEKARNGKFYVCSDHYNGRSLWNSGATGAVYCTKEAAEERMDESAAAKEWLPM